MNKKGQGISMTYIIIAALALVVLVVIILFFTGGLQTLFQQQKETVAGATDQQLEIWRGQCKLYCSLEQRENFLQKEFTAKDDITYTCKTLDVECGECTGKPDKGNPCTQRKTQAQCIDGCDWTQWQ